MGHKAGHSAAVKIEECVAAILKKMGCRHKAHFFGEIKQAGFTKTKTGQSTKTTPSHDSGVLGMSPSTLRTERQQDAL